MVTEFRKIVFSNSDLTTAIANFYQQKNGNLSLESIKSITVKKDDPRLITVIMSIDKSGTEEDVTIETAYLAAAMLRHCFALGIPVPRGAKKNIEVVGDNLALNLSMNAAGTDVDIE